jgi:decaprenylphospho-beta-D-erythro-pentofuranosid-2-ulose 2-reductase
MLLGAILILGATSSIARACAEIFAQQGYSLFLAGRDVSELSRLAKDLQIRFKVTVDYAFFNVLETNSFADFFQQVLEHVQVLQGIVMAVGLLGHHHSQKDIITANFLGPACFLEASVPYFIEQKKGFILGLSSVAGDRGRRAHYAYGASKAALTTYLQGLRSHLNPYSIQVLTVKLGLIDTKMTFGTTPYPLFLAATPQKTGIKIVQALNRKKESVYVPKPWRIIMYIIRIIPEKIFKHFSI